MVPNRYPAFERQEVVIHLPRHARSLTELSDGEIALVAEAWGMRARAAAAAGYGYVHAFVNESPAAGASLTHSHSQLVWLREPPPSVRLEGNGAACRVCALLAHERHGGLRLVTEEGGLVATCAAAGRQPYELLVAPTEHDADAFGPRLSGALALVARLVRGVVALEGSIAWNAWLHLGAHWHVEVLPRLTTFGGVELGTGIHVLELAPEEAAASLRAVLGRAGG